MKKIKNRPINIIYTTMFILFLILMIKASYDGYINNQNKSKQIDEQQHVKTIYTVPHSTAGINATNIKTLTCTSTSAVVSNENTNIVETTDEPQSDSNADTKISKETSKSEMSKPTEKPTKESTSTAINDDEVYMLSHLIYAEGGDERYPDELRYYIGSVVLNRIKSKDFPNTMQEVIFQKGQYQCTWIGTYYNEPSEKCIEIAKELLQNGSKLPEGVVYQAEFRQGSRTYTTIGNTYFCYQ